MLLVPAAATLLKKEADEDFNLNFCSCVKLGGKLELLFERRK